MRALVLSLALVACTAGAPSPERAEPSAPAIAGTSTQASQVRIGEAWARAVPPGTPNSAVFLTLHNDGAALAGLIAADSDASGHVELHTHAEVDGVMKMRRVARFGIPGSGHHHLRPGGDHLMLIGLTGPLAVGSEVALTLTFADGSSQRVAVPVRSTPPGAASDRAHGHGADGGHGADHGHAADGTGAPTDE